MHIYSNLLPNGFQIEYMGNAYAIRYDKTIWEAVPDETRLALKDNLSLATTMHLPLIFQEPVVVYHSGRPLLEPYFIQNFLWDIPSCTEVDGTDTTEAIRRFFNTDYQFINPVIQYPSLEPIDSPFRAIVGLSFGKDSLLSFAIAQEIGLEPEGVYAVEESMTYEEKHKTHLVKQFKKEFGTSIHILIHETGLLRDYDHLGLPKSEFGWGLQSTEYALDFVPFAYALRGKYLLFGNEQTASATYMDKDNMWIINPCYDQSHKWTVQINQIIQAFSGRSLQTGSVIEPLMDMMVQRTLGHRYPNIAKYQMSCFTETEAGRDQRWCHSCSICAKMYLLCVGSGIDPAAVGFTQNMLMREHKHHFTLFGGKSDLTYANTRIARDEQLFAFYCATRKQAVGTLVDDFKASPLYEEANQREDELFKTFTSLYEPISMPPELKIDVLSILKEEVKSFEI